MKRALLRFRRLPGTRFTLEKSISTSSLLIRRVFVVLTLCAASRARGQSDISGLFAPWHEGTRVEARGDAVVQCSGHTQGSDFRLGLATYELNARLELMHEHEINPT